MKYKIYIIILNYNGWKDTIECLESVLKIDYENYQIIVVDNASPNNSMQYMINWAEGKQEVIYNKNSQLKHLSQPFEPKPLDYVFYSKEEALIGGDREKECKFNNPIIFIQAGENGGFAAGNNIGIKYALVKDDFEYVWLLNNDTVIEKESLNSLVAYAKGNNIGICGSSLYYYFTPNKIQSLGGKINKLFGTDSQIKDINNLKEIDYVVGASFLIERKVIDKIGLLPEEYFLYYEETDYCFEAKKNGFKVATAIESIVYHKEGGSTGLDTENKVSNEFTDVLGLKNRIKFHRRHLGGGVGLWIGLFIAFTNRVRRGQAKRIFKVLM